MEQDITTFNERVQALADQLARTKTVYDLSMELATYIIKEKDSRLSQKSKIVITESDYRTLMNMFRVKGYNEDGTKSLRGRPKK